MFPEGALPLFLLRILFAIFQNLGQVSTLLQSFPWLPCHPKIELTALLCTHFIIALSLCFLFVLSRLCLLMCFQEVIKLNTCFGFRKSLQLNSDPNSYWQSSAFQTRRSLGSHLKALLHLLLRKLRPGKGSNLPKITLYI